MRNKLTSADFEISNEDDKERWLTNLYFETATMIDEGLLTHESSNKNGKLHKRELIIQASMQNKIYLKLAKRIFPEIFTNVNAIFSF